MNTPQIIASVIVLAGVLFVAWNEIRYRLETRRAERNYYIDRASRR